MRNFTFLIFVFLTFCCWGIYGPVLHLGQESLGDGPGKLSSLRPFICVGMAYFLIAVVYPIFVLRTQGESGAWSVRGFIWSFIAGAVGAVGALGIILAFKFGGKPVYVMPLVFGLAPVVNTFVTMATAGTFKQAKPIFFVGIVLAALGAAGVLRFKPTKAKPVAPPQTHRIDSVEQITLVKFQQTDETSDDPTRWPATDSSDSQTPAAESPATDDSDSEVPAVQPSESPVVEPPAKKADINLWLVAACITVTALCWGAYGPVLHSGQALMSGSRLRPFLCVGLAYFAIAVIVPLILTPNFPPEPGSWNSAIGIGWSLLAGAAGAIGALGIIYAFNFGGKPIFIMPLVFGIAPVVNTLTETFSKNLVDQVSPMFLASLATVIVGATIVLVFAPRGPKKNADVN